MKDSFIDADVGENEEIILNTLPPKRQYNSILQKKSNYQTEDPMKISALINQPGIEEIKNQILNASNQSNKFVQERNSIIDKLNITTEIQICDIKQNPQFVLNQNLFLSMIKEFSMAGFDKLNNLNQTYFILAQKPQLIQRNFEISTMNDAGAYGLWTNQNGVWSLHQMDGQYPVFNDNLYILDISAQFWRILLDKSLAQTFGSYNNLLQSDITQIISSVTGCPYFKHQVLKNTYPMIKKWIKNGFLVYLRKIKQNEDNNDVYYSVSMFYEKFSTNSKYLICQSMQQNIEGFQVLDQQFIDQNQFKIAQDRILQYKDQVVIDEDQLMSKFDVINVVKIHENYYYKWQQLSTSTQKYFQIKFSTQEDIHAYMKFSQKSNYQIRLLCFKLSECDDQQDILIKGIYSTDQDIFINHNFIQGNYTILFEICNQTKITEDIIFSSYAQKDSLDFQVTESNQDFFLGFQQHAAQQLTQKSTQTQTVTDYSAQNLPEIKVTTDVAYGMLYFYYDNQSDVDLEENLDISELKIFRNCQFKTEKQQFINIKAKTNQAIIFYDDTEKKKKLESIYTEQQQDNIIDQQEDILNKFAIKVISQPEDIEQTDQLLKSKRVALINNEIIDQYLKNLSQNELNVDDNHVKIEDFVQQLTTLGKKKQIMNFGAQIDVDLYVLQHNQGIVFYYQNKLEQSYSETITFSELVNLTLQNQNVDGSLQFTLQKNEQLFIFLDIIEKDKNYSYKNESKFYLSDN